MTDRCEATPAIAPSATAIATLSAFGLEDVWRDKQAPPIVNGGGHGRVQLNGRPSE